MLVVETDIFFVLFVDKTVLFKHALELFRIIEKYWNMRKQAGQLNTVNSIISWKWGKYVVAHYQVVVRQTYVCNKYRHAGQSLLLLSNM